MPPWVRPNSSPPSSMGTPWDRSRVARKLRCCRRRNPSTLSSKSVAFGSAVPRPVVALAVGPAFAVGVVVFLVVGDKIGQGEAVVGGDEVDAGPRVAGVGLVEVGAAGEAGGELAQGGRLAPPEVPDGDHVVAVGAARRGLQERRAVQMGDAEVGQIAGDGGGGVEGEPGVELHPVGPAPLTGRGGGGDDGGHGTPSRLTTTRPARRRR